MNHESSALTMHKSFFPCLVILFLTLILMLCADRCALGQVPFERLEMGMPAKAYEGKARDVSNPEHWEETRFMLQESVIFFGKTASETQLSFWNDRLYAVSMAFPENEWSSIAAILQQRYGSPWKIDSLRKEGYWGSAKNMASTYLSSERNIMVSFHDEAQKDFHWQDLFKGALLYVIIAIAGLFIAYFLIAHLFTSFCPQCKSFAMELQEGVQYSNPKSYHTDVPLFSTPNIEYDKTYTYQCTKCGHIRRDTTSGWWEHYRKTKNNR